jgi:hypothetical protein
LSGRGEEAFLFLFLFSFASIGGVLALSFLDGKIPLRLVQ